MTEKPKCADEGHQDAKAAVCSCCCVYIVGYIVLKITSYADPCFVTDKVAGVVNFVRAHLLERQYLLAF